MSNRLAEEISPYLLQHAENPVDWQPWGDAAFATAAAQQKPVFLSIGYSACHWCHVMAHESFENAAVAELLNQHFVSIKVDREERPDIDQVYMEAVQMMTSRGGWPLSVFLTPAGEPFFGGTYWPLPGRQGMAGFDTVLRAVRDAWQERRTDVFQQARQITTLLAHEADKSQDAAPPNHELLEAAETALIQTFDAQHGGFGPAPKFPRAIDLGLLLDRYRRTGRDDLLHVVTFSLDRMAAGGIYDHLGGGFHRYSVDDHWLVPHFEKMLYDNAMLAGLYLDAWQVTGTPRYATVVRETLDYLLRDMADPAGGFYSAEDADSEGEEGKFYLWTSDELQQALGRERADVFTTLYGVTAPGNFEGRNILHQPQPVADAADGLGLTPDELARRLAADRDTLLAVRNGRVRPACDDKVLVSWNGLTIDTLARAGALLEEPRYRNAAAAAADFVMNQLRDAQGRLLHCWRRGQARHQALLDDYASLIGALVTLAETQELRRWLGAAKALADDMLAHFRDAHRGDFFYTADDQPPLLVRKKDVWDSAVPSGAGLAATALLRLARIDSRDEYRRAAEATLRATAGTVAQIPMACGQLLRAMMLV
jgi:uncharacterized protein